MIWSGFDTVKAIKAVMGYQVISFDIFDTLIKRNVSTPTLIFNIVEDRYNLSHPREQIEGYRALRMEAERKARANHADEEVTLDEIYDCLELNQISGNQEGYLNLKKTEIEVELDYCEPNIPVLEIYNQCHFLGKRVIITSDMYLPKTVIEEILRKCGIHEYEKLYLSSDIKKQKKTGALFDYILEDLGVRASEILHFGDRKKADNIIPRLKGMGSFYVNPVMRNTSFISDEKIGNAESSIIPFINNRLPGYGDKGECFRWGYEAFGPLILGFVTWIHKQIVDKKIQNSYFLARDMNLVIQVYRRIYGEEGTTYLEVSRASLRKEYVIRKNSLNSIFDTMGRRGYTVRQLLEELQLDGIDEICTAAAISPDVHLTPEMDIKEQFPTLDRYVIEELKNQENHIVDYLYENGLFQPKSCAIIDIGWHGTIQNMLETITGKKFEGLYFGNTQRNNFPDMSISGYWFDEKEEGNALPYLPMVTILEVMLFNDVGTVLGYEKKDNRTVPVYRKCEMVDFSMIAEFQTGAMAFVEDYVGFMNPDMVLPMEEATMAYRKMAFYPTVRQANTFSRLPYEDGKICNLADAKPLHFYLLHPACLMRDYMSALWKEGFIKQVLPFSRNPYQVDMIIKKTIRALGIKKN